MHALPLNCSFAPNNQDTREHHDGTGALLGIEAAGTEQ
jgi:hypothetical protein